MPVLSVIIPVYNAEKFLGRCIESVLNQSYKNLELILVNDGSTDRSLEICRDYKNLDSRVFIIDKNNEGAGPTRNAGMALARGKYLAFPDADDRMALNAYQYCIDTIEASNADLLIFGMSTEVFDDEKGIVKEVVEDHVPDLLYSTKQQCREMWPDLSKQMDLGSPCNKIFRKSIIDKYRIEYPDMRRMQDTIFNLRYFDCIQSIQTINKNFYIRTWHSKEMQRRKMPKDFIKCAIQYHEIAVQLFKKWSINSKENLLLIDDSFSEIVMTALFDYLPSEHPGFGELYRHIKGIVTNDYIQSFYCEFENIKKLRKLETAIRYRMSCPLTLYYYWKARKQ